MCVSKQKKYKNYTPVIKIQLMKRLMQASKTSS